VLIGRPKGNEQIHLDAEEQNPVSMVPEPGAHLPVLSSLQNRRPKTPLTLLLVSNVSGGSSSRDTRSVARGLRSEETHAGWVMRFQKNRV